VFCFYETAEWVSRATAARILLTGTNEALWIVANSIHVSSVCVCVCVCVCVWYMCARYIALTAFVWSQLFLILVTEFQECVWKTCNFDGDDGMVFYAEMEMGLMCFLLRTYDNDALVLLAVSPSVCVCVCDGGWLLSLCTCIVECCPACSKDAFYEEPLVAYTKRVHWGWWYVWSTVVGCWRLSACVASAGRLSCFCSGAQERF